MERNKRLDVIQNLKAGNEVEERHSSKTTCLNRAALMAQCAVHVPREAILTEFLSFFFGYFAETHKYKNEQTNNPSTLMRRVNQIPTHD